MSKILANYLKATIEGLKDAGVKDIVLSPGSRSTPLAILFEQDPELRIFMDVDERSAAFFALGLSKATQRAVACVCTSGTAAANYFPAVCEAMESQIPLIILTTDRPSELRYSGAPQTMDQTHLYGNKVKFSMEYPLPEDNSNMLQFSYSQMFQVVTRSLSIPMGPVHVNFPFREPLIPESNNELPNIKRKVNLSGVKSLLTLDKDLIQLLKQEKGLFLIGETPSSIDLDQLILLSEKLGWPIFSDSLANIKTSSFKSNTIIDHHDLLLKHVEMVDEKEPTVIVRIGRALLSKTLNTYLSSYQGDYVLIDETGLIPDYSHQVSMVVDVDVNSWLRVANEGVFSKDKSNWLNMWVTLDEKVQRLLKSSEAYNKYSELYLTKEILSSMPDKAQLFIGNSMPIRDVDTVLEKSDNESTLFGTRGINGIDGIVSSAFGMAAAKPDVWNGLLIGDISFFHSMNGLSLGNNHDLALTLFVINNNGGGIFSMLPQNQLPNDLFERLFGTPQGIDLEGIAKAFTCEYQRVTNKQEWEKIVDEVMNKPTLRIVELVTSRDYNKSIRQSLNEMVASQL